MAAEILIFACYITIPLVCCLNSPHFQDRLPGTGSSQQQVSQDCVEDPCDERPSWQTMGSKVHFFSGIARWLAI